MCKSDTGLLSAAEGQATKESVKTLHKRQFPFEIKLDFFSLNNPRIQPKYKSHFTSLHILMWNQGSFGEWKHWISHSMIQQPELGCFSDQTKQKQKPESLVSLFLKLKENRLKDVPHPQRTSICLRWVVISKSSRVSILRDSFSLPLTNPVSHLLHSTLLARVNASRRT